MGDLDPSVASAAASALSLLREDPRPCLPPPGDLLCSDIDGIVGIIDGSEELLEVRESCLSSTPGL